MWLIFFTNILLTALSLSLMQDSLAKKVSVVSLNILLLACEMFYILLGYKNPTTTKTKSEIDDKEFVRIEAIICSMTMEERRNPKILNGSRRLRIAKGSGTKVQDINKFISSYEMTQKLMKKMQNNKGGMKNMLKGIDPNALKGMKF